MKWVDAAHRIGEAVGDRPGDPRRHVAGHQLDLFAARFAELVEEALDDLAVAAGGCPDQPAGVVVDDDGQVALALTMRYLIDPDPSQAVQEIGFLLGFRGDTLDDGPTVRHATRISSATADLLVLTASHATWSSKSLVKREL